MEPTFDQKLSNCPLCGNEKISDFKTDFRGIHISKCQNCETEFMNPQYTLDYLNEFYGQYQGDDFNHHRYGKTTRPRELVHEYNIKQIENHISPGNFLSVGCGNAFDVKVALDRGWHAEGYEVDQNHAEALNKQLSANFYHGDFIDLNPGKQYHCIYLNHVLEHPKNPGEYLTKIRELLFDDGILYIACPNIDSLSNRVKTLVEKIGLKKTRGKHYDTWQHLFYYNPHKLSALLENNYGFKTLYIGNDKKAKSDTTDVKHSWKDDIVYRSSFRLLAQKKNP